MESAISPRSFARLDQISPGADLVEQTNWSEIALLIPPAPLRFCVMISTSALQLDAITSDRFAGNHHSNQGEDEDGGGG